ncbi:MAG TPA: hypothetical protein VIL99_00290 [Ignavibacteria bacterium]
MKLKLQILFFLAIILFISSLSFFQVTRKVLFKEGTNESCPTCAASNPILEAFLQSNQVLLTKQKN